jgi:RNA polymerase sigma factor (sigma-70 family)
MTRLPTIADVDADLVAAARDGDPAAVEQLVAAYLPLVYNVIGRALNRGLDVDDTVQETMLHVVRGLPELRDPAAFRSWLLAITMNEVRRHHRQRVPELRPLEAFDALIEPASDFADLTIWRLGLTGQRMETAKAASWLDDQDRELMSLWFLVEAGQLSRAEMVAVLGVGAHTTTVRVTRMKAQLAVARAIVRALAITPPCPGLTAVAADWSGVPSSLWRKRFARHMRECDDCVRVGADLIPAEHLLPGLLPLPVGLAGMVSSKVVRPAAVRPVWHHGLSQTAAHRRIPGRSGLWSGKAAVGAVGATVAIGGAAAVFVGMGRRRIDVSGELGSDDGAGDGPGADHHREPGRPAGSDVLKRHHVAEPQAHNAALKPAGDGRGRGANPRRHQQSPRGERPARPDPHRRPEPQLCGTQQGDALRMRTQPQLRRRARSRREGECRRRELELRRREHRRGRGDAGIGFSRRHHGRHLDRRDARREAAERRAPPEHLEHGLPPHRDLGDAGRLRDGVAHHGLLGLTTTDGRRPPTP